MTAGTLGAVLAIVGPTASGKSARALDLAHGRDGIEIVAIDAFSLYRGMDVATAKPTAADRAAVPHHLVDILDAWEDASVAWFQDLARTVIADVHARGSVPLLVGGSGLYWRAVVDDLRFPPTDAEVRAGIEARYVDDAPAAHAALGEVDPEAAARIGPNNLRRSVRALEVIALTGERFSAYSADWERYNSVYPDLNATYVDLPDAELRDNIRARAERMVADGLVDEAKRLLTLDRPLSRTAAHAIGYAEAFAMLDGTLPETDLTAAIAARTWRYAKRQRAWFRRDPRLKGVAVP